MRTSSISNRSPALNFFHDKQTPRTSSSALSHSISLHDLQSINQSINQEQTVLHFHPQDNYTMSPSTLNLSSFLAAIFIAAATGIPNPVPAPVPQTTNPVPPSGPPGSACVSRGTTLHIEWGIYVVNTTMPSDQGSGSWGGGLLDNINGAIGCAPTSWQAQVDAGNPQGVGCTFNTPIWCQTDQIVHAIHAASSEHNDRKFGDGQWVYCEGDTLTDLFDSAGQIISGFEKWMGDAAGILTSFAK